MGFRLNLKLGFPIHSHSLPTAPSRLPASSSSSSSSVHAREASFNTTRLFFLSIISEEGEKSHKDPLKAYASSYAAPQTLGNDFLEMGEMQSNKRSYGGLHSIIEDTLMHVGEGISSSGTSLRVSRPAHFSLLMENLDVLEETFADKNVLRLERDILLQLGRLGALKLFNIFLSSRTIETSNIFDLSDVPTEDIKDCKVNSTKHERITKKIFHSGKKEKRKSRRARVSENSKKISSLLLPSKTIQSGFQQPSISSAKRASNSRSRILMIARNEAEMARGVKEIAELERIRTTLEDGTGQVASISCWAEAAGLDPKVLRQRLHFGWYCQDELLRSTRSLIIYLTRYYRGVGVAFEDLLQAGKMGVLQGAERFDHTRGFKFSTYVQFWIRKSMSMVVTRDSRNMQIPYSLSQAINQIQKAQKALMNSHGKYPDDTEIAKFTGLSLAKIASAKKCPRFVGSLDRKVGDSLKGNYLEILPDKSMKSPEEALMRQHMRNYLHDLLKDLDPKESKVLVLRYGLEDNLPKSLEETGKLCHVSKEWVRKLEMKALKKLRNEETLKNLRHYLAYIV
uniref:Sigma factor n=1 Tax=Hypseocharis bilobata TaxID=253189 RepID=A0A0G2SWU1_9ROSI|nr:sigma factor [Hypseocharis bilobata]